MKEVFKKLVDDGLGAGVSVPISRFRLATLRQDSEAMPEFRSGD